MYTCNNGIPENGQLVCQIGQAKAWLRVYVLEKVDRHRKFVHSGHFLNNGQILPSLWKTNYYLKMKV